MLSALGNLRDVVTLEDAHAANKVIGRWVDGITRLRPMLHRRGADAELQRLMDFAMEVLDEKDGTVNRFEVSRALGVSRNKLNTVEETLVDGAYIKVESDKDRGGKKWSLLR